MSKPTEIDPELEVALSQLDVFLFTRKCRIKDARELITERYRIDASNKEIADAADYTCRYWRQRRRKRKSATKMLGYKRWDEIKAIVENCAADLQGLNKEHAFELIRAYASINYSIMDGLPKRLRFWEQVKGTRIGNE